MLEWKWELVPLSISSFCSVLQSGSIDSILDAFFGFLQRKTDFFTGAQDEQAKRRLWWRNARLASAFWWFHRPFRIQRTSKNLWTEICQKEHQGNVNGIKRSMWWRFNHCSTCWLVHNANSSEDSFRTLLLFVSLYSHLFFVSKFLFLLSQAAEQMVLKCASKWSLSIETKTSTRALKFVGPEVLQEALEGWAKETAGAFSWSHLHSLFSQLLNHRSILQTCSISMYSVDNANAMDYGQWLISGISIISLQDISWNETRYMQTNILIYFAPKVSVMS